MGSFIFDPLTGEPTILATNRTKRPDKTGAVNTIKSDEKEDKPKDEKKKICVFCKGNEHLTPPTVYQDSDEWNVRVIPNKFPLLDDHEVIIHSPSHDMYADIDDFDEGQIVKIIRAYLDRVTHFNKQEKEVIIFNNRGGKAGASILHPHSQLVAAKGFPGIIEKEKDSALHYYNEHNSCYWCDEIEREQRYEKRVVIESTHFIVYVPNACRWSYELRLVPKNHKPNFGYIDEREINDFARVLKMTLRSYDKLFNRPDRNFWIHNMRYEPYHWHVGFIPQIKVFGALEFGAGIWVSDKATPEDAAEDLRSALEQDKEDQKNQKE